MAISAREAAQRLRDSGDAVDFLRDILNRGGRIIGSKTVNRFMRDTGPTSKPNRLGGRGSLRVQTGRLARSYLQTRGRIADTGGSGESIARIVRIDELGGTLVKGSKVPYAPVHELGYRGVQQVPAHQRTITQAFGRQLDSPQTVKVSPHQRAMNLPARPHLMPGMNAAAPEVAEYSRRKLAEYLSEKISG